MVTLSANGKVEDLDSKLESLEQQKKLIQAQKKRAALIVENFPQAIYGVRPDGSSGYIDRSINSQTHGVIRRHSYHADQKRYSFFYEKTVKIGKISLTLTSEAQDFLSSSEVCALLDQAASIKKKPKEPKEQEVTPEVRGS